MTEFGRALRSRFLLDPEITFLNHGSFGTIPREVFAVADGVRQRFEANPDRFIREILPGALREAAARMAEFVHAAPADVTFVDNATAGANTVLRALDFQPNDEILTTTHAYGAVINAIRYVAGRSGAKVVEAPVPLPALSADAIFEPIAAGFSPRTKLLVIDHITSATAMIFPVERLVKHARERGVRVMIDGAHVPGHLPLDVPKIGADWYFGNCHKWLFSPRGCAFFWASPEAQTLIHPLSISHGYGKGFIEEFDWTGTRDPAPFLSVPAGIDFHRSLGEAKVRDHNRALALAAGQRMAQRWGEPMNAAPELLGAMVGVRLPERWQRYGAPVRDTARKLTVAIAQAHRINLNIMPFEGALWCRVSAQVYNEMSDYDAVVAFAETDPPPA